MVPEKIRKKKAGLIEKNEGKNGKKWDIETDLRGRER